MKKIILTITTICFLFTTVALATIYEDAEHGTTNNWRVYDNIPSGTTINNILDTGQNSKVIQFQGNTRKNGYILGDFEGKEEAWNNKTEQKLIWNMKYSEPFIIYVRVMTKDGGKYIVYTNSNDDKGLKGNYIFIGLGSQSSNGSWQTFEQDLKDDLKKYQPNNDLISVNAFLIRGSGYIDNIQLTKEKNSMVDITNLDISRGAGTVVNVYWDGNPNARTWLHVTENGTTGSKHKANNNTYTYNQLGINHSFTLFVQGEGSTKIKELKFDTMENHLLEINATTTGVTISLAKNSKYIGSSGKITFAKSIHDLKKNYFTFTRNYTFISKAATIKLYDFKFILEKDTQYFFTLSDEDNVSSEIYTFRTLKPKFCSHNPIYSIEDIEKENYDITGGHFAVLYKNLCGTKTPIKKLMEGSSGGQSYRTYKRKMLNNFTYFLVETHFDADGNDVTLYRTDGTPTGTISLGTVYLPEFQSGPDNYHFLSSTDTSHIYFEVDVLLNPEPYDGITVHQCWKSNGNESIIHVDCMNVTKK